jgi:hypothetical integral membrane protein (TIGR02206 family)
MAGNVPYAAADFAAHEAMHLTFEPFSKTHAAVVVAFAALVLGLVALRRRWARTLPPRAERLDRALAAAAAVVAAFTIGWPLLPRHFDLTWSLPLHVCDLAAMVAPVVLWTCRRLPRALLYFWGLGLSSQGFSTPDLRDGPAKVEFWVFWLNHFAVVGSAIYDLAGRGYRPTWRDYRSVMLASVAYLAVVLPLDVAMKLNYGYVGPALPGQPTIVDVLGPWPLRVIVMFVLAAALMALMTAPWQPRRRAPAPQRPYPESR